MRRRRFFRFALSAIIIFILAAHAGTGPAYDTPEAISIDLKSYLDASKKPRQFLNGCEPIHADQDIDDFYARRNWQPVWISEAGPSGAARKLVAIVGESYRHGLFPRDYHHHCLFEWLQALDKNRFRHFKNFELEAVEVALSDAFIRYGSHLANGKVDPASIYPRWSAGNNKKKREKIFKLMAGIDTQWDIRRALEVLAPSSYKYLALMAEARRLQEVIDAGGWPEIPKDESIGKGDSSSAVPLLAKRLSLGGHLPDNYMDHHAGIFDAILENGVQRFQKRHGLAENGVVNPRTLAALNELPEDRLKTVFVNMERWRWLPRDLGRRHIIVNTAGFGLEAYKDRQRVLKMAVIVGEDSTMTPVFTGNMTYLELNPYWNVPRGILERKILPEIKKDPGYVTDNRFELIKGWGSREALIDPATIDWSNIGMNNFPGRLRQAPGPWNALGRIKFMFPNKYNVYLHDTPDRHLFRESVRTFSSGCIRVKRPIDLALFVLQRDSSWDRIRIKQTIETGETTVIPVNDPVPVHLLYQTFWVDPRRGEAHYRDDVYGLDCLLWEALRS